MEGAAPWRFFLAKRPSKVKWPNLGTFIQGQMAELGDFHYVESWPRTWRLGDLRGILSSGYVASFHQDNDALVELADLMQSWSITDLDAAEDQLPCASEYGGVLLGEEETEEIITDDILLEMSSRDAEGYEEGAL